ncbi:ift43 [Symbiodinium sp. CCMP2456]|nr:ift43 [Symbiodinium sp. CCMP2456]
MDDEPEVTQEGDVGGSGGGRAPRPRGPVTGGWGFDDDTGGPRMSAEPPSPQRGHKGHFEEDDDAVPTIPDLEEEAEEDITRQVAAPPIAAPSLAAPVRTVRELDGALISRGTQLPTTPEEGVDLAPLMQCLCSDRQVFEQDSTWDHELIFQEVASAINQDLLTVEEGEVEESEALGR